MNEPEACRDMPGAKRVESARHLCPTCGATWYCASPHEKQKGAQGLVAECFVCWSARSGTGGHK